MTQLAACTVLPISSPTKVFRLLPAGHFKASDGRPKDVGSWFIDSRIADALIQEVSARTTDLVIDYEHQTLNAEKNGKPSPAAGWFHSLEWREGDGLYVTDARWTDSASKMLNAHEYRFISPVFSYDGKTGAVLRIVSAALTNNPALDGLTDLAAATRMLASAADASNAEIEHANEVLLRTFGKNAATVSAAAKPHKRGDAALTSERSAGLDETNAKLREIFGPGAALAK